MSRKILDHQWDPAAGILWVKYEENGKEEEVSIDSFPSWARKQDSDHQYYTKEFSDGADGEPGNFVYEFNFNDWMKEEMNNNTAPNTLIALLNDLLGKKKEYELISAIKAVEITPDRSFLIKERLLSINDSVISAAKAGETKCWIQTLSDIKEEVLAILSDEGYKIIPNGTDDHHYFYILSWAE